MTPLLNCVAGVRDKIRHARLCDLFQQSDSSAEQACEVRIQALQCLPRGVLVRGQAGEGVQGVPSDMGF